MGFRFKNIDWKKLSDDKKVKFNVGLTVVIFIILIFFIDVVYSIYRFKNIREEGYRPAVRAEKREKKEIIIKKAIIKKEIVKKEIKRTEKPVKTHAKVAIILDDAGTGDIEYGRILSIKLPITISVLPKLGSSQRTAKNLRDRGYEVMLHVPMEPNDGKYLRNDSGMLLCSSSEEEIRQTFNEDLDSVKWVKGVNNHLGSKATSDERIMKALMESIKEKGLFFVDSKTSGSSVALRVARQMNVRSTENNMFLDGDRNISVIKKRFRDLISYANRKGSAVGIGHATRPETLEVLRELMPEYAKEGIKFVYVSELVK